MNLPLGNNVTPYGSPYHIYQLLMLLLRETAKTWGGDNFPFKYTQDFTTTGLLFDTIYNKDSSIYGKKPLIVINRGGVSLANKVLGDKGGHNFGTTTAPKTAMSASSVSLRIMGCTEEEVDILGNYVFDFLVACRTLFPQLTTIHDVTGVSLSPVAAYQEGDHRFYCMADFSYLMQSKWTHTIPAEVLRSILMHLNQDTPEEREFIIS